MLTKKITMYENGVEITKEIPLEGQELVDAKIIDLKERVINKSATAEEVDELASLSGQDVDLRKAMLAQSVAIQELANSVAIIAQAMSTPVV